MAKGVGSEDASEAAVVANRFTQKSREWRTEMRRCFWRWSFASAGVRRQRMDAAGGHRESIAPSPSRP
jgi:hypothetical protein